MSRVRWIFLVYSGRHVGEIVSVDELVEHIWGGRLANATQIYKGVSQLRTLLSVSADARHVVEMVPKRGYRLLAPVIYLEPTAELRLAESRTQMMLIHRHTDPELAPTCCCSLRRQPRPEDAYFAAGLHEEVLGQLAKLGSPHIKDRYLVFRYQGTAKPIAEIA